MKLSVCAHALCSLLLASASATAVDLRYSMTGADATYMAGVNHIELVDDQIVLTGNANFGSQSQAFLTHFSVDLSLLDEQILGDGLDARTGVSHRIADGGLIVALASGVVEHAHGERILLVKLDADRVESWRLDLAIGEQQRGRPAAIIEDPADGSIFLAATRAFSADLIFETDVLVYKVSATGTPQWSTALTRPGHDRPALLLRPVHSERLIIRGHSFDSFEIGGRGQCRVDAIDTISGELLWERRPRIDEADLYCFATRIDAEQGVSMLSAYRAGVGYVPVTVDADGVVSLGSALAPPFDFYPSTVTSTPQGEMLVLGSALLEGDTGEAVLLRIDAARRSLSWHRMLTLAPILSSGVPRDLRITSNGAQIVTSFEMPKTWRNTPRLLFEMHSMTGRRLALAAVHDPSVDFGSSSIATAISTGRFVLAHDFNDHPLPATIEIVSLPLAPFSDGFE